jgi:hypothetical protein
MKFLVKISLSLSLSLSFFVAGRKEAQFSECKELKRARKDAPETPNTVYDLSVPTWTDEILSTILLLYLAQCIQTIKN